MRRTHFLQHWFNLSNPAVGEELYDIARVREFLGLDSLGDNLHEQSAIIHFWHLLETLVRYSRILDIFNAELSANGLLFKSGTVVHTTLIAAPTATKNSKGERNLDMRQTKRGIQWYSVRKEAYFSVDGQLGLVHTVVGIRPTSTTRRRRMLLTGIGLRRPRQSFS